MTGYGHTPLFGAFVTPSNDPPQRPVELAVAAERAGFDLVTFQDHPYQARFHDTWTLMAYVAARTSRIRIAGNVLNLPLRQPAVLARSAISLDLLSQGRFEMALGAGGFWDPIVAMGGRRLTPGQSRRALDEAIRIMRQMWPPTSGDRCASTATITGWSAPSAAPHPPTRSASGSADTSPGCWS
jgi:alkanesulfonate monooxygenase SsuD/methylene tetrahydromethanopterin reductase-like flavin-dependent oxidoreductase (luciferase family)